MTYLFLDLETTGLDPSRCGIVEIACSLFESLDGASLMDYDAVIMPSPAAVWEPIAYQMHYASGLLEGSKTGQHIADVDALFEKLPKGTILAGNSIHFDRGFIKAHMPVLESRLSYRMLDVTSVAMVANSLGAPTFLKRKTHRSRDDINETLAELFSLRQHMMGLSG